MFGPPFDDVAQFLALCLFIIFSLCITVRGISIDPFQVDLFFPQQSQVY